MIRLKRKLLYTDSVKPFYTFNHKLSYMVSLLIFIITTLKIKIMIDNIKLFSLWDVVIQNQ